MSLSVLENFFRHTPTVGVLAIDNPRVIKGSSGSKGEGAILELYFRLDEKCYVTEARFKAHGCGYLIASASYVTQSIIGKSLVETKNFTAEHLVKFFDIPEKKLYVALMIEDAIKEALTEVSS